MANKEDRSGTSLEKVSTVLLKERLNALLGAKKLFKAVPLFHLPSANFRPRDIQKEALGKPKPTQQIAVHTLYELDKDAEEGRERIRHTAFDTHLCSRRQELHLLHYSRVFHEGHFPKKKVMNWRLPKLILLRELILSYNKILPKEPHKIAHSRTFSKTSSTEEQEDRKQLQEQLNMQKTLSEKRNYLHSTSIFS